MYRSRDIPENSPNGSQLLWMHLVRDRGQGVDLSKADAVVLVQPTWASNATPPLRTWLRAHQTELTGRRLALLVSNWSSPGDKLRTRFEGEFGPVTSFAVVHQRVSEIARAKILGDFVAPLR